MIQRAAIRLTAEASATSRVRRAVFRQGVPCLVTSRVARLAVIRRVLRRLVISRMLRWVVIRWVVRCWVLGWMLQFVLLSRVVRRAVLSRVVRQRVTNRMLRWAATRRQGRPRGIRLMMRGLVTSQMPRLAIIGATVQRVLPSRAFPAPDIRPRVRLPATHPRTRHWVIRPRGRELVIRAALMRRPIPWRASRSTTGARAGPPDIQRLIRDPPTRRPSIRAKTNGRRGLSARSLRHIRPTRAGPVIRGVLSHPRTLVGVSSPRTQPRARRPAIRRETVGPPPTHPIRRLPWPFLTTAGRSPTHPSRVPPKQHWKPEAAVAPGPGRVHELAAS